MLRRLGINASAPLFIPGVGALVMLKQHITDPILDARIGLAGPVWGLGAAVAAWVIYQIHGAPIWLAIAELTGFLNLFNLMPIWQLDGSRGFHALSRQERWMVVAAIAAALALTGVRLLLWILAAVAIFRTVRGRAGPGPPADAPHIRGPGARALVVRPGGAVEARSCGFRFSRKACRLTQAWALRRVEHLAYPR